MPKVTIADAITLFEFSDTARGGRGAVGTTPPLVVTTLKRLYAANEIGFQAQPVKTWRGSHQKRAGFDIQISPSYIDGLPAKEQLAALSLVLVHEAVHEVLEPQNISRLVDEMGARKTPIYYYRELAGPGVFNEAADFPGSTKSTRVRLPPGTFPEYSEMSALLDKDQLVDFVVDIKTYRAPDYLNAQWVVDNLGNWGGPRNRQPKTKGRYIKVLAQSHDPHYASRILDIMESVDRREDWDTMMAKAGSLRTIQIALEDLAANKRLSPRIGALEKKWRVALTERP
jgi:hypothetical protein